MAATSFGADLRWKGSLGGKPQSEASAEAIAVATPKAVDFIDSLKQPGRILPLGLFFINMAEKFMDASAEWSFQAHMAIKFDAPFKADTLGKLPQIE